MEAMYLFFMLAIALLSVIFLGSDWVSKMPMVFILGLIGVYFGVRTIVDVWDLIIGRVVLNLVVIITLIIVGYRVLFKDFVGKGSYKI